MEHPSNQRLVIGAGFVAAVILDILLWNGPVDMRSHEIATTQPSATQVPEPQAPRPQESEASDSNHVRPLGSHSCDNYPDSALRQHIQGSTVMSFRILADGTVRDLAVTQSSGNADLDSAAIACASRWRYFPATQNGVPVEESWKAQVQWVLQE